MSDSSVTPGSLAPSPSEPQAPNAASVIRHVVHQIRQPLSVIEAIGYYLDLVLPELGEEARSQVSKLRQQANEIDRILSDTIHYFQASPLRLQQVDLSKLIRHQLSDEPPIGDHEIDLQLAENLQPVRVDFQQVHHLLRNLLHLYGKIVPLTRQIVVSTHGDEASVYLQVAANESNYSAVEVATMFEPTSILAAGEGLTLASVRRIADLHDARIAIHSIPAGGLTVSVAFPFLTA